MYVGFTSIIPVNSHNNPVAKILQSHFKIEKTDSESINQLAKVTQLVSGKVTIPT